jgi:putative aldouronate transport system permease protein
MIRDKSFASRFFDGINILVLALVALACLFPFVHMIAVSLSNRAAITGGNVSVIPIGFNLVNYQRVINDSLFLNALSISFLRTIFGTALSVTLTVITAYPLAYPYSYRGQGFFKGLLIFIMMFSGGLIPWFLVVKSVGLTNNIFGLIIPSALQVWNVILMVNFFRDIPIELMEAAEMDGASHWDILFRVFIPISLPAIAVVTLYTAVGHWNSWFDGLVLMNSINKYPLQSLLQTMVVSNDYMRLMPTRDLLAFVSQRGLRAAQIVIAIIPIALVYPFLQRYFVSGLRLGSVKG